MTTYNDIMLRVRQRTAMENDYYISQEELLNMVNNSMAELYDAMVTDYEDYFLTSYIAAITDGYNMIPIPSNCLKLRGVDYCPTNNTPLNTQWYSLRQIMFPERNRYNGQGSDITAPWGKRFLGYRLEQNSILLTPTLQTNGLYQVWYTPKYPWVTNSITTVPINMDMDGWIEYAVVGACVKIMNKQQLDITGFMAEKSELKDRVVNVLRNRDSSGPKRMINARFNVDYYSQFDNGFDDWC